MFRWEHVKNRQFAKAEFLCDLSLPYAQQSPALARAFSGRSYSYASAGRSSLPLNGCQALLPFPSAPSTPFCLECRTVIPALFYLCIHAAAVMMYIEFRIGGWHCDFR